VRQDAEFSWTGERDRQQRAYRPCSCGVCSRNRKGVGYVSSSDSNGNGFTIWIENERIFQRLRRALWRCQSEGLRAVYTNCNQGLQNTAPPRPDRIELLKQVRRATIDDQMYLLDWLEKKYGKIRPPEKNK
jgi:hypothetical protein